MGDLGSAVSALLAGQLLALGWHWSLTSVMVAAFLIGYSMMTLVPHLQENVSLRCAGLGTAGTNTILVAQALGAFAAPYFGTLLGTFIPTLAGQFLACAAVFVALVVASAVMVKARC